MGFIYKITNTANGKVYIGQTRLEDPNDRWKLHIKSIAYGNGCPALANAVKHYGLSNFKFEVILICFDEDRFAYEREYIKKYNSLVPNGYNITEGGEGGGGFKGKNHTDESRQKISETMKEIYADPEHCAIYKNEATIKKRIETLKQLCSNPELRAKRSEIMKRYYIENKNNRVIMSDERKQRIKASLKKYYNSKSENGELFRPNTIFTAKSRKIAQYTLQTREYLGVYVSIRQASITTGVSLGSIKAVLAGKCKHAGGYHWEYVNE